MKKLIKRIVLVVVLVVIVVAVALVFYLNSIARSAVQTGATTALGVDTTVQSVRIGVLRGEAGIRKLNVANPAGYESDHFLALGSGDVAVSLGSLMSDTVRVPRIELAGIDMNLEKKGGKANYQVIMDNLKKMQGTPEKPAEPAKPGKQFVVENIIIRDVTVHAALSPIGGKLTAVDVHIPEIRFAYDSKKGVPMSELSGTIMKAVFAAIVQKGGGILPADIFQGLEGGLEDLGGIGELGVQVVGDVTKQASQIAGQAVEDVGKAAEGVTKGLGEAGKSAGDVGKEAGKAMEGLGGMLGGDKKKDEKK